MLTTWCKQVDTRRDPILFAPLPVCARLGARGHTCIGLLTQAVTLSALWTPNMTESLACGGAAVRLTCCSGSQRIAHGARDVLDQVLVMQFYICGTGGSVRSAWLAG